MIPQEKAYTTRVSPPDFSKEDVHQADLPRGWPMRDMDQTYHGNEVVVNENGVCVCVCARARACVNTREGGIEGEVADRRTLRVEAWRMYGSTTQVSSADISEEGGRSNRTVLVAPHASWSLAAGRRMKAAEERERWPTVERCVLRRGRIEG